MKMEEIRVLIALSLLLAYQIGGSYSQANCHCDFTDASSVIHQPDCNSSEICPGFEPAAPVHGCLIEHVPRRNNPERIDIFYSCVKSFIVVAAQCSEVERLEGLEQYSIKVLNEDPLDFSICCFTDNCNTEELLSEVLARLAPPTDPPTTTTMQLPPTESDTSSTPLYFIIVIPVLCTAVIVAGVVIVLIFCFHFVSPRRSSDTSTAPTITSRDSSSCGDPSLNDILEYSGSGAGLPLLVQRSIAGQIGLHELIGKGRYGEVWKGSYKCDEVAVKIFNTREEASWAHEVDIYRTCLFRHPNILRFIASDNKDIGVQVELWLITEFCEYGSLYDFLNQDTLEPSTMLHLAYTASCGLDHLHTEIFGHEAKPAIVHRDLKSRNILVKADHTCCIGDLGLALRYNRVADQVEDPPSKRVGTKRYLAPEIIDESIMFKHFESFKRADIYSFGLVMWEITMRGEVNGVAEDYQMPYQNLVPNDPSFEDMKKAVVTEKLRPTLPNRWTQSELFRGMSKLIQQCWLHDSDARLTSLRLKKSLHNLQQSCVSEKKKEDKEQSA